LIKLTSHIESKIKQAELLVMGGSAGSFTLIQAVVKALPKDFALPVLIVLHRGKQYKSLLEDLLQLHAAVKVDEAQDKEQLRPGHVYIAPADYHLLAEPDGSISLDVSEPVWFCRPSIDVLFESAADSYKGKTMGILLSGANEDGAAGLQMIRRSGGLGMVQDPEEAEFSIMPGAAVKRDAADLVFRTEDIPVIINNIHELKKHVY
jgi:two-component system chemotaxis response regulator CheB